MLGGLFIGPTAAVVDEALARSEGIVCVVGPVRLARALAERGKDVVAFGDAARPLRRVRVPAASAAPGALPLFDGSVGAVVIAGFGTDDAADRVREGARCVAEGGCVVLVDRTAATDASRSALCGGLMAIEQRAAGRVVVTSGLAPKLPG